MSIGDALPRPEMYYDPYSSGKCFFVKNNRGSFIPVTEGNLKRHLRKAGFASEVPKGVLVSEIDGIIDEVQTTRDVEYAGPLAGYGTGEYKVQTRRVLVTEGPRLIEPEDGPWPTLGKLWENLLGEVQLPYFYSWLKVAASALRAGKRRPGQALVIAGPRDGGKSLTQNLITEMLGGRSAKPYRYMRGATEFNADLFEAEHLMIEDEVASNHFQVRREFGAHLKAVIANETQQCHGKGKKALTLTPFWRVTITLNEEPESLMVLPPLDDALETKVTLLRAARCVLPMPTETLEQWGAFRGVLAAEVPCFLHWLLKTWVIPASLVDNRYGVRHYHQPDLLELLGALAPEARLLELIDTEMWRDVMPEMREAFDGKACDLEVKLCAPGSKVAHEARKLMTHNSACGSYLGRLMRMHPERIKDRIVHGHTIWTIEPLPVVG